MTARVKGLGAFILPMATALMGWAASLSGEIAPLPPALQSVWLPIHAAVCILAYAIFFLSFALSVMFLIQERQIKKKRLHGLFQRLPSLEGLDALGHRCIVTGFVLLTIGIFTGSVWAEQAWGSYWSWDPKETWSLITWFIYAAAIHARLTRGWTGKRMAGLAIIGFAAVLFTYFGVNFWLSGLHSYASSS
jgi:cytochrome c-type biogenesis protein CcsB